MRFPRRQFLHLAAGAAALPSVSRIARAQTYPARPITMDLPWSCVLELPGAGQFQHGARSPFRVVRNSSTGCARRRRNLINMRSDW